MRRILFQSASLAVCAALAPAVSQAQVLAGAAPPEQVLITARPLSTTQAMSSQQATVITGVEIHEKAFTDLTEILRTQPSVEFKKAGAPGQFNYIKLRGFSDSILVVIDGVKVNEPSQGNTGYLIGQIDPNVIERVEVLRGPQATLYGANSTAGVISITTKSGATREGRIAAEYGTLEWKKAMLSLRDNVPVGDGTLYYSFNASGLDTDGVHDFEYSRNLTTQGKLDYSTDTSFGRIDLGLGFFNTDNEFQYAELTEAYCCQTPATYWSFQTPDPHQTNGTNEWIYNAYIRHQISSSLTQKLRFGGMKKYFNIHDAADGLLGTQPAPFNGFLDPFDFTTVYNQGNPVPILDAFGATTPTDSFYRDESNQTEYTLTYDQGMVQALGGFEYIYEHANQYGTSSASGGKQKVYSYFGLAQLRLLNDSLTAGAGVRLDDYSYSWGQQTTYNLGAAYNIANGVTLFANYGTSFTAPNMFQLYSPTYGTTNLDAASGKTFEGGFRLGLFGDSLRFNATYFNSAVDDVIVFDYTIPNPRDTFTGFGQYGNGNQQKSQGAELDATYSLTSNILLSANYTYTDSQLQDLTGVWAPKVQVAQHKGNLGISYTDDRMSLGANLYITGPRWRWAGDVKTEGYTRLDVSGRYRLIGGLSVYARIENALNADIIEELGYKQPRFYGIAGLEYSFF